MLQLLNSSPPFPNCWWRNSKWSDMLDQSTSWWWSWWWLWCKWKRCNDDDGEARMTGLWSRDCLLHSPWNGLENSVTLHYHSSTLTDALCIVLWCKPTSLKNKFVRIFDFHPPLDNITRNNPGILCLNIFNLILHQSSWPALDWCFTSRSTGGEKGTSSDWKV